MKKRRWQKSEAQKKREAKKGLPRDLEQTKQKLGIGHIEALKGATPSPLVTKGWERKPKPAPTSDRIPGAAPVKDLMHAHQWKRGAEEKPSTVKEIRRKASQIGPAYNKGALQYLPSAGFSDGTDPASTTRRRPGQIDAFTGRKNASRPKTK
jgi:hypothetical protein